MRALLLTVLAASPWMTNLQREVGRAARPAFERHTDDPEATARDLCPRLCALTLPADARPPERTELRVPFIDVDGLALTATPEGRIESCGYTRSGRGVPNQPCASWLEPKAAGVELESLLPAKPDLRAAWAPAKSAFLVVERLVDEEDGQEKWVARLERAKGSSPLCLLEGKPASAAPAWLRGCLAQSGVGALQALRAVRPEQGRAVRLTRGALEVQRHRLTLVTGKGSKPAPATDLPGDFVLSGVIEAMESPDASLALVRLETRLDGERYPPGGVLQVVAMPAE